MTTRQFIPAEFAAGAVYPAGPARQSLDQRLQNLIDGTMPRGSFAQSERQAAVHVQQAVAQCRAPQWLDRLVPADRRTGPLRTIVMGYQDLARPLDRQVLAEIAETNVIGERDRARAALAALAALDA